MLEGKKGENGEGIKSKCPISFEDLDISNYEIKEEFKKF